MPLGPINYSIPNANPLDTFMRGIGQAQQMEAQDFAMQQAKERADRFKAMSGEFSQLLGQAGVTGEQIAQFGAKYPEATREIQTTWQALDSDRQKRGLRFTAEMYGMLQSGNTDMALSTLDERIRAAEQSGNIEQANFAKIMRTMVQQDPKKAANYARVMGRMMGGDSFDEMIGMPKVRSSQILPDGTAIGMTDAGPIVFGPGGEQLTGQAAADAIRRANEYGASVAGNTAYQRKAGENIGQTETGAAAASATAAGTQAVALAGEAFKNVGKIRQNIANLDQVIAAIDKGANTGVIMRQFPSWNAATIELENAANKLGLDVVGSVTFGALSEGELRMAMSTALPDKMSPPELKKWVEDKKAAQQRMADELYAMARFLAVPGNTLDGWLKIYGGGGEARAGAGDGTSIGRGNGTQPAKPAVTGDYSRWFTPKAQ